MTYVSQPGANLYSQGFGSVPAGVAIPHLDTRAPATTDILYGLGKRWVNTASNTEYTLTSLAASGGVTSATWTLLGTNTGALNTLSDTASTTISPSAGNIQIAGTSSQISATAGSSVLTLALPSAVTAPGSLASTTTLTAGSSLTVTTSASIGTTLAVAGTSTIHALSATTGTFSSTLGVTGLTTLTSLTAAGTTHINITGAAVTTIGTGGTGAVNIGNATGNTAVTGSLTASTGLVATTGGVTATAGGLIATAGNLQLNGDGGKIVINIGGSNPSAGTATLTLGVATITTTAATNNSKVFVSYLAPEASAQAIYGSAVAGTVTITSQDLTDSTSTVNWFLIN